MVLEGSAWLDEPGCGWPAGELAARHLCNRFERLADPEASRIVSSLNCLDERDLYARRMPDTLRGAIIDAMRWSQA